MSKDSSHVQSGKHKFKPFTPTTQSGDGPNIDTKDNLCFLRSTLKCDEVFLLTSGYHNPAAFINVLRRGAFARSSISRSRTDPHSAIDLNPSVAI